MTNRREFVQSIPALATLDLAGRLLLDGGSAYAQQPVASPPGMLARDIVERRAIEAMIWGMPAVNLDLMYQAMLRETPARANQMLYWSRLLDWKNQTLTPNTDVIYLTPYFDTRDVGPVVLEIPPADDGVINGTIMDAWQMPLEDVGPAGVDAGKGGKYVVLPPGYAEKVPDGYIALPSLTYKGYALLRSILRSGSDADLAKAVEYGRRIKIYPLSQAANPPPTTYVDADGVLYDATIPYDVRFFESLDRDRAGRAVAGARPRDDRHAPDDRHREGQALRAGCRDAQGAGRGRGAGTRVARCLVRRHLRDPWAEGSRWAFPASPAFVKAVQSHYADPNVYPIDDRGVLFTFIFFTPKRLGEGQFYLMLIDDKAGAPFDGARPIASTCRRMRRSPVLVGDGLRPRTHALIREVPHAGRSSQSPGLQTNADGSVDLYFGPKAPAGKEANWTPTRADGKFEVLFRFYGPEPALFDKTWVLPDIEEIRV